MTPGDSDVLVLRSLSTSYPLPTSAWPPSASTPPSPQPILLHAHIHPPSGGRFTTSATLDILDSSTLSYAVVAEAWLDDLSEETHRKREALGLPRYRTAEELAERLCLLAIFDCEASAVELVVELPSALLHASSCQIHLSRQRSDYDPRTLALVRSSIKSAPDDRLVIKGLRVACVIGVLDFERREEQVVETDITLWPTRRAGHLDVKEPDSSAYDEMGLPFRQLSRLLHSHISRSSFQTVEALATSIASVCLSLPPSGTGEARGYAVGKVTVKVEKPSAVTWAQGAGCQITRTRGRWMDLLPTSHSSPPIASTSRSISTTTTPTASLHTVYLGLGTNLGSRLLNLHLALQQLKRSPDDARGGGAGAEILDVSFAYETEPMFVQDQPRFLNAVCKITTRLEPLPLLDALKSIEARLGRDLTGGVFKGPRPIDLDILLFDDRTIDEERLKIPHPGLPEREFVLRPLHDIAPSLRHPTEAATVSTLLARLTIVDPTDVKIHPLIRAIPIPGTPLVAPELDLSSRTHIMAILNATPDSFSDGGDAFHLEDAVRAAQKQVAEGADIIDVGGMSTRPGAEDVSVEEELRRTVPIVRALREQGVDRHISIDTFRAAVARAAVAAGATMVNDVTGGRGDPLMLSTVSELGVPYVLMHMRGTPRTMARLATYEGGDVVAGVKRELEERVEEALKAGVRRWNLILDPGIGFAKGAGDNVTLLRELATLTAPSTSPLAGFPVLVGASRKTFLGKLTGAGGGGEPRERDWATAATTVAAVVGGAAIVRVHNTAATRDVVRVADALYRPQPSSAVSASS